MRSRRRPRSSSGCRRTRCHRKRPTGTKGSSIRTRCRAGVDRTSVRFIIRDFLTARLAEKENCLAALAREAAAAWPGAGSRPRIEEQYRNMREVLDQHPHVIEYAREAMRRVGIEVRERPIRGGTDGSKLSFMGLPTPNIFAGEHNFHSRLEWVSVQDMEKAVEVIVELARVWHEHAPG